MTVKATREGLPGQRTASGFVIDDVVAFVALPSTKALRRFVRVTNPANGKRTLAQVLDVGPWNVDDDEYVVYGAARPLAERGVKTDGRQRVIGRTNGAGIDLGEAVWRALGLADNANVEWEFV